VTSVQRARLVVALGILNLALATMAFAVGTFGIPASPLVGPAQPSGNTAVGQSPSAGPTTSQAPASTPSGTAPASESPGGSSPPESPPASPAASPTPSSTTTAVNPNIPPATIGPTLVPSGSPGGETPAPAQPTEAPTVPTAQPTSTPSVQPTVAPTPAPTTAPTTRPTPAPTAQPAAEPAARDHPPCPQDIEGPPGHNKTSDPKQPCGQGKDKHGSGKDHGQDNGVILIVPFLGTLIGLSSRAQRRLLRRRHRRHGRG
jgi:hypothetical protein